MNKHTILAAIQPLDVYSQLACLGSMQFSVTADVIRRATKIIPDHPTPETMEAFLNEERNLKLDVEYAGRDEHGELVEATSVNDVNTTPGNYYEERRTLAALLDLRQTFLDMSDELGASIHGEQREERTLLSTMQFMTKMKPDAAVDFANQYTRNMRLGMKNYGQTRAQFVAQEMERAARNLELFIAKGEHAVQFLEGLDPIEGPIDERMINSLARLCVGKLIKRRVTIGQRINFRMKPEERDEAEADILFIETAIVALDGEVPAEAATPPEVDADGVVAAPVAGGELMQQFLAFVASQTKQDPKAPGPVTITKH